MPFPRRTNVPRSLWSRDSTFDNFVAIHVIHYSRECDHVYNSSIQMNFLACLCFGKALLVQKYFHFLICCWRKRMEKNFSGFILSIFECFWNYSGKIYHHISFQSSQVKTLLNLRLEVVRKDVSHTVYYQLFLKCSFNLRFLITNK